MITTRYHLVTVISIFLALGVGILLGGSLGQQWLSEKQQSLMTQLEQRYNEQLAYNRKLSADIEKVRQAYREEKTKVDDLLQLTVGNVLHQRHFIIFSRDPGKARRLEEMIRWAGGRVRIHDSLQYLPVNPDGVILMADGFSNQLDGDVLRDLQLLYRAPVVVHTTDSTQEWQMNGIFTFNGAMSEPVTGYRFLEFLGKVIAPMKEGDREA